LPPFFLLLLHQSLPEVLELLSLDEHGGGWRVGSWHIQRTVLANGDAQMARALGGGCVLGKVALRGTAQGLLICKTLRNGRNGDRVALRGLVGGGVVTIQVIRNEEAHQGVLPGQLLGEVLGSGVLLFGGQNGQQLKRVTCK